MNFNEKYYNDQSNPTRTSQRKAWREYLRPYPWEWAVTFTIGGKERPKSWFTVGYDRNKLRPIRNLECHSMPIAMMRLFKKWRLHFIDEEKMQLGMAVIFCIKGNHWHAHALMFGRNRLCKQLIDCDPRKWQDIWPYFCKIRNVYSSSGAVDYFAGQFRASKSDHAEVEIYNPNLLKRVRDQKNRRF